MKLSELNYYRSELGNRLGSHLAARLAVRLWDRLWSRLWSCIADKLSEVYDDEAE